MCFIFTIAFMLILFILVVIVSVFYVLYHQRLVTADPYWFWTYDLSDLEGENYVPVAYGLSNGKVLLSHMGSVFLLCNVGINSLSYNVTNCRSYSGRWLPFNHPDPNYGQFRTGKKDIVTVNEIKRLYRGYRKTPIPTGFTYLHNSFGGGKGSTGVYTIFSSLLNYRTLSLELGSSVMNPILLDQKFLDSLIDGNFSTYSFIRDNINHSPRVSKVFSCLNGPTPLSIIVVFINTNVVHGFSEISDTNRAILIGEAIVSLRSGNPCYRDSYVFIVATNPYPTSGHTIHFF